MVNKDMKTISKIQEKRQELKELSASLKKSHQKGAIATINDGLKSIYAKGGHTELNTLRGWNKAGKKVIKGSKALLLWGRPKKYEVANADTSEIDKLDYYPICFVFSNLQVEEGGKK